jgi:hypothetical protein
MLNSRLKHYIYSPGYSEKIVDHDFARQRAISVYKSELKTQNFLPPIILRVTL